LLYWAEKSITSTTNQSALPHAIIVLNKTSALVNEADFDINRSTESLLCEADQSLETNPDIDTYVKSWRSRGRRITNTQDLLLCYYSTIRVIRIPEKGRYMLIDRQVKTLHHEIEICCRRSCTEKRRLRRDLNAEELKQCLQAGLEHFSANLYQPFDFLKFSWNLNPIAPGFGGNILRLALAIKEHNKAMTGVRIFIHLGHMVASCIMLDYVRNRIRGRFPLMKREMPVLTLYRHAIGASGAL
jgi:hypothetical protein